MTIAAAAFGVFRRGVGSSHAKDPLRLLEAAYSFVPDEQTWLRGIVGALSGYELGRGIAAYTSNLGETVAIRSFASADLAIPAEGVHAMAEFIPAPFYRLIHAPTPLVSNRDCFPEAAKRLGLNFGRTWPTDTPFQVPDAAWAIAGGDAGVESVLVTFHCEPGLAFSARDRHTLDCLAAHLGSALRLRNLLGHEPTSEDDTVDVVLSPDGKVLDARGDVRDDTEQRASLVDAVKRSEGAKLRKATAEERVDVWTALIEGRWSILESTERDGKRVILACRNEPRTSAMRTLTPRERNVATYAALGHSFKYIAYELGVPLSTAASSLESALRKLSLSSREELIALFARGIVA